MKYGVQVTRKLGGFLLALATLIALFAGMNVAPHVAHAVGPYTLTLNTNPGGTTGGAFLHDGTTYTLTSDASGRVSRAQFTSVPTPVHTPDGSHILIFRCWASVLSDGSFACVTASDFPYSLKSNKTLYAMWDERPGTMTFKAGDATGGAFPGGSTSFSLTSMDTGEITESQLQNVPTPMHANNSAGRSIRFIGWFSQPVGGTQLSTSSDHNIFYNETWYAHYSDEGVKLTLDAGSDGHFPVSSDVTNHPDPANHVYAASGSRTYSISPDSSDVIHALQIEGIPEAFRKNPSTGEIEVSSSWKSSADGTGLTLPDRGLHLAADATYHPVWKPAEELDLYSTNSLAHFCSTETDYNHCSWQDLHNIYSRVYTWSGVPGIRTDAGSGLSPIKLHINPGISPVTPVAYDSPIAGTEVTLYGRPEDEINLTTYFSYLDAKAG